MAAGSEFSSRSIIMKSPKVYFLAKISDLKTNKQAPTIERVGLLGAPLSEGSWNKHHCPKGIYFLL